MVSDEQIIMELLALVDSTPLSKVNFRPILLKYSEGLEFNEQRELRGVFRRALLELKNNNDIDYYDPEINISTATAMVWTGDGGLIKSTLKRKEKLEQIERDKLKSTEAKIQYFDSYHTEMHGANSTASVGNTTNTTNQAASKEKWYKKIIDEVTKNAANYIVAVIIGYVGGLINGVSCNKSINQSNSKTDSLKTVQTVKKI